VIAETIDKKMFQIRDNKKRIANYFKETVELVTEKHRNKKQVRKLVI
jgi:hypothetical protein